MGTEQSGTVYGKWSFRRHIQMLDTLSLSPVSIAIDVGCGNGWLVRELLTRGVKTGIGLDISPKMISVAHQSSRFGDRERYVVGNGEAIELPTASVDCITNIESLYYYPKPEQALKEWARIAKSGAQLAIMMDLYVENSATHTWIDALEVPVHLFSMIDLKDLLERNGWSKIEMVQRQDRRPIKDQVTLCRVLVYHLTSNMCRTER